jgi:hypothetical protein
MNNNLEFENTDPSPDSVEDNHPRTNYGEGFSKQETIQKFIEKHGITEQQLIDGYKQGLDLIFENASKIDKQETLEEVAERIISDMGWVWENTESSARMVARHCAKSQERSYSEEDLKRNKMKQETLKELSLQKYPFSNPERNAFITGYNQAKEEQQNMYSEEDLKQFAWQCVANFLSNRNNKVEQNLVEVIIDRNNLEFEQFKKK